MRSWAVQRNASEQEFESRPSGKLAKERPSRSKSRRQQRRRAELQRAERSLRSPQGPAKARGLRPIRACRLRSERMAAAASATRLRLLDVRISSTIFSASSWAGAAAPASARAPGASAAPTCATIWRSRSTDAFAGKTAPRSACPRASPAKRAPAPAPSPAPSRSTCPTCGGPGKVRASQGFFTIERTCPSCQGPRRGHRRSVPRRAPAPAASPRSARCRSISRPGVEDGTQDPPRRATARAGLRGGPPGDLYIFLSIKPHEFFQRDGADIFCKVPIAMTTAALGGQIEVPALDGSAHARQDPEGTETGKQFRLKGKGMPVLRSRSYGDMYIQVEVETPKSLTTPAARAAGGVRAREPQGDEPGELRLLRAREGVLRRQEQLRFKSAHDQLGAGCCSCRQRRGRLVQ